MFANSQRTTGADAARYPYSISNSRVVFLDEMSGAGCTSYIFIPGHWRPEYRLVIEVDSGPEFDWSSVDQSVIPLQQVYDRSMYETVNTPTFPEPFNGIPSGGVGYDNGGHITT